MFAMKMNRTFAVMAALVAAIASAGCGGSGKGSTQSNAGAVTVGANLVLPADVTTVSLAVTGPNGYTYAHDMNKVDNTHFQLIVADLPPGGPYDFAVEARNGAGVATMRGTATGVTIVSRVEAVVNIVLHELTPPDGSRKRLPQINAISASGGLVDVRTVVNVNVNAVSPEGHALTYLWTATGTGCDQTFASATSAATTWTAPAAPAVCVLSARVADATNVTSVTAYLAITVQRDTGDTNVNVSVDTYPTLVLGTVDAVIVAAGQTVPNLTTGITATILANGQDPDGSAVTFAWTSSCGGTFTPNATTANVTFHTDNPNAICTLTLVVTDTSAQSITGTIDLTGLSPLCAGVTCQPGFACNPVDGSCMQVDPCVTVTCTASDSCHVAGTCHAVNGVGVCSAETAITCAAGSACRPTDGLCHDLCEGVTCSASDLCHVAGTCSSGTCSAETPKCAANQTCNPADGSCTNVDPCAGVTCAPASDVCHVAGTCANGTCSAETAVVCPAGQVCSVAAGGCITAVTTPVPTLGRNDGALLDAVALGVGADGTIYRAGSLSQAFDFGSGTVNSAGSADMWLGAFNATAGLPARWAASWGDTSDQFATGLAVSPHRVAVIGNFTGTLNLGGGRTATNPNANVGLPFVAIFNPATATATTAPTATYLRSILMHTDAGGGALNKIAAHPTADRFAICGLAQDFQVTDLGITSTPGGGKDLVIAVIDETATNGILWARQIGGTGDQTCAAVAFDQNGDVVLTGNYQGVLDFGAGALPAPVAPSQRIYVAKLNGGTGATIQAVSYGAASGSGINLATAVAVLPNNDVVVGGNVRGRITMGTRTLVGAGTAFTDGFLAVLSGADLSSVATGWPVRIGGSNAADAVNAVAVDGAGQIWVTGYMSASTVYPGTDGFQVAQLTSLGSSDAYVLRLSPAGAVTFQANYGDAGGFSQSGTLLAASGNTMFLGGTYGGAIDIGALAELTSASGTDIRYFLVQFQ